jgi:hypothetical protein
MKPIWDAQHSLSKEQDQSPDISYAIYWTNLNWLTNAELLTLTLISIVSNEVKRNEIIRVQLLVDLPVALKRTKYLTMNEKLVLLRLLDERLNRKLPLYENHFRLLVDVFGYRRITGLLSDKNLKFKLQKRLKPKRVFRRSTKNIVLPHGTQVGHPTRIRGYRDHGTARRQGTWLPKSDWSFTANQWRKEIVEAYFGRVFSFYLGCTFATFTEHQTSTDICFKRMGFGTIPQRLKK